MKKQDKADRLDESLSARHGAEWTKTQSFKSRRDESKGKGIWHKYFDKVEKG